MKKKSIIVVDEAVPEETSIRFQSFLKEKGHKNLESFYIKKEHSGMPDVQILHHLLNLRVPSSRYYNSI